MTIIFGILSETRTMSKLMFLFTIVKDRGKGSIC